METGIFLILTLSILTLYKLLDKIIRIIYRYINKDNQEDQDNEFWKEL